MEACFSQLTLNVIGKAVFNYEFNALTTDSPLIQVRIPLLLGSPSERSQSVRLYDSEAKQQLQLQPVCTAGSSDEVCVQLCCCLRNKLADDIMLNPG